jgi:hypothetical protein
MNAQMIGTNIIELKLPSLPLQYYMIVNYLHLHATYNCSRQHASLTSSSRVFFITLVNIYIYCFDFKSLIIAYARTLRNARILHYHIDCKLSHGIFKRYDYMMTLVAYYICGLLFIFYYSVYFIDIAIS